MPLATDSIVATLRALAAGDLDGARAAVADAVDHHPDALLPPALASHLARPDAGTVYDRPEAFQAFIAGGGNVALYEATSRFLRRIHAGSGASRLLDLGTGDGRALVPSLEAPTPVTAVTAVEPSQPLLDTAVEALFPLPVVVEAHHATAEQFVAGLRPSDRWDVVQATFALSALPPDRRAAVLASLRGHATRVVVVEFDVPPFEEGGDEHLAYLARRYEAGLAEYGDDVRDLVAHGFLLPVLLGQVDRTRPRATWEQPADRWVEQLEAAGWDDPRVEAVSPYWWAPAVAVWA